MRSGDLPAYLSLNGPLNSIVSYSIIDALFFEFSLNRGRLLNTENTFEILIQGKPSHQPLIGCVSAEEGKPSL